MESAQLQRRVLQLAQERGDTIAEKEALLSLGQSYEKWGDLGRTARYYEQYLALARQQRDQAGEMLLWERLGDVYVRSKQYKLARPLYEQYLVRLRRAGKPPDLMRVMGKLGDVVLALLDAKGAADIYELGLEIAREASLPVYEADLLSRLALAWHHLGRKWRAGRQAEKALRLAEQEQETAVLAQVSYRVARLYVLQSKWTKAAPVAQQALQLFVALNNQEMVDALQIMVTEIDQKKKNSSGFLF